MVRRNKDGTLDRRTREARQQEAQLPVHEIEAMIELILPAVQSAARRVEEASARVAKFKEQHPELAEMQRERSEAMRANNAAVLPLWGLLNKLAEMGDEERWQAWCAYLNDEGPYPRHALNGGD
jgi:hypothetical protein